MATSKFTYKMPVIDLSIINLNDDEQELAAQILKPDGRLFGSKPSKASGEAKYLWRMVAFGVSTNPKHHCIPVTADFDLDGTWDERRARSKVLDKLADRIETCVPVLERHGTMRWGRALGMIA